jgi:UDP-3-O-[3-hydroxymyristoyl] glucosamine N-acyltransferase
VKLRDIAERLKCRLEAGAADDSVEIHRVAGIEHAGSGDLTFVANPRYQALIAQTRASAIILGPSKPGETNASPPCAVLRAENPYLAFAHAVDLLVRTPLPAKGVDRLSSVAADAVLGADVSIGPFVAIGAGASIGARTIVYPNAVIGAGARLGDDCVIHSRVSIRERVVIGNRVIVQDGAVIGSDGFGFVKQADGTHFKIPQHADVVIEDDVEIGANTTIDRPAVGETRIRAGAKIDNLVQIGHGVSVGRRALLAAQVGIAGSTALEDDVVLAGQVGVAGHLRIGQGAVATAQTGIPNSVGAGEVVSGYPAIPNREWLKASAVFRQLPDLRKRIADLEARLAALEGRSPQGHREHGEE